MKISCPACAAKYSIADEKVQDKLAKIRCRKCGTTIVIDGKVDPPSVYAGDATASQTDVPQVSDPGAGAVGAGEYSVDFGDNDQRTMTVAEIVAAYNAGQMTAETFVWADGMADWQPMGQVPALVDALHAASAPAAAPPSGMINSSDFASPAPAAPWEAKGTDAARPAARVSGRGSTADLFGSSFEGAGGEADVTTSAREPAPTAASAANAGGTGARNESSVLFSLSALTSSAAPVATPSAAPVARAGAATTTTKEDSGLIDLKALTAASDAPSQPIANLTPSPFGMAPPLGLAPPLGSGVEAQIAPMAQPAKSKAGIFIGAGIAFAALAIAAAIVVVLKPPPPAPAPAATQAPTVAPTAAPTPTDESTAKPPATGTAEEDKKPVAKRPTGGPAGKPGGAAKPPPGGETKPPPGGETKPKPKPSGGCGCASGDLQCAMKCAAGGG